MRRDERDEVMYYCGVLKGICASLRFGDLEYDSEEDCAFTNSLISKIEEIAEDLECVAKGADKPWKSGKIFSIANEITSKDSEDS